MAKKMRAAQVAKAKGPLEIVELDVPEPKAGEVRVKIHACGVCHSDSFTKEGAFPGIVYPRVPGHEVAGVVDAVGPGVTAWKVGDRVGIGWHGGQCNNCDSCKRGDYNTCSFHKVTGVNFNGGYAEYTVVQQEVLAAIPDELSFVEAAPLLCAGITTYNALRNSGARPGDTVAVLGIGGLGHLGVQYAHKMGFKTVAIARGKEKGPLAKKLGADVYLDSETQNVAEELTKMGGARVILSTITDGKILSSLIEGLNINGKLVLVGVTGDPIAIDSIALIRSRRSVVGWPSGAAIDSQDTMNFSALTDVKPLIEEYPLEKAAEAYDRMMSGKARFRVVLNITGTTSSRK